MKEMDVKNFDEFTAQEHRDNLKRLGVSSYGSLVGQTVHYCHPAYGDHVVVKWNPDTVEFLLSLDGQKFWTNPFRIKLRD